MTDPAVGDAGPDVQEGGDERMLMRTDPFYELERFTQQVFDHFGANSRSAMAPMEAYRDGDQFVVHFDLPGIDPGSIDLSVERDVLTLKAERTQKLPDGVETLVSERPYGSITRQLFLGEGLDTERIEASYDAGVLTLRIPVMEQAKPRRIEINASAPKAIAA
jgi:HSP20 family protein